MVDTLDYLALAEPVQGEPADLARAVPHDGLAALLLGALAAEGRAFRVAYESPSLAGLVAAVRSGLAVAVLARSSMPDDLRPVPPEVGLPRLPHLEIALVRSERDRPPAADALAALIRTSLGIEHRPPHGGHRA